MNLGALIAWGLKVTAYLESAAAAALAESEQPKLAEKPGWLKAYRAALGEWEELMELLRGTEKFVREKGFFRESQAGLEKELPAALVSERNRRIKKELLEYVKAESAKAQPGARLGGSSEVIESVFGKYKRLIGAQAERGMIGRRLSLGALVSRTSMEVVKQALETVPTKKVLQWCKEKLGKTLQAKKRAIRGNSIKTEQKLDQLKVPA